MSKSYVFNSSKGIVTVTECGDYRKSSPFDPEAHDYSVECGDFYAELEEIDFAGDIADALEEAGIEIDRDELTDAIENGAYGERYIVRDEIAGTETVADAFDLEDVLAGMLDVEQEGVQEAIDGIARGIKARDYIGDYEAFLKVRVTVA